MRTRRRAYELAALGILPCTTITMIANHGYSVIFKVDDREFAADREIASGIRVGALFVSADRSDVREVRLV
jgi:Fe2+ transport system protein FeoA